MKASGLSCSIFLLFCLSSIPAGRSGQQTREAPPPLFIQFFCPSYPVSTRSPITLFGDIFGTEDPDKLKGISFCWKISRGKFLSGQGTRLMTFQANTTEKDVVEVRFHVEGGPPELNFQSSCLLTIDPRCSL